LALLVIQPSSDLPSKSKTKPSFFSCSVNSLSAAGIGNGPIRSIRHTKGIQGVALACPAPGFQGVALAFPAPALRAEEAVGLSHRRCRAGQPRATPWKPEEAVGLSHRRCKAG